MPEGSSSEAPVISPGPRLFRRLLYPTGCADSAGGLLCPPSGDCFEAVFLRFALPDPAAAPRSLTRDEVLSSKPASRGSIAARGRDRVHAVVAEHMCHESRRLE